jgi:DnaJ family protein C protein 11/ATP-dependent RNA helicase DDX10/DBP4
MVDNDTLDLYENVAMCDLLGFCDPCPGEDKHLRVRYRYRRALHEVTVKADAMVSLPSADHRLPEKLQTIDPRV